MLWFHKTKSMTAVRKQFRRQSGLNPTLDYLSMFHTSSLHRLAISANVRVEDTPVFEATVKRV